MNSSVKLLAIIGTILSSATVKATGRDFGASSNILVHENNNATASETEVILSQLIQAGHARVDESTGEIILKSNVIEILKDHNLVKTLDAAVTVDGPNCSRTVGGFRGQ